MCSYPLKFLATDAVPKKFSGCIYREWGWTRNASSFTEEERVTKEVNRKNMYFFKKSYSRIPHWMLMGLNIGIYLFWTYRLKIIANYKNKKSIKNRRKLRYIQHSQVWWFIITKNNIIRVFYCKDEACPSLYPGFRYKTCSLYRGFTGFKKMYGLIEW